MTRALPFNHKCLFSPMSVASAPSMSPSSEDPRSLPPFSNFIAISSRPPLHPHSNSFPDARFSLAAVPSSPDRDHKEGPRPPASGSGVRTSPSGLDRVNSTGKGSGARLDESGPTNDDSDRPKRKRQSQSKFEYRAGSATSFGPCYSTYIISEFLPLIFSHMSGIHLAST